MESAHRQKIQVLLTDAGSYLGANLAHSLILQNCQVFGIGGSHIPQNILKNRDFTLLEIDLSQPLPAYLPNFDIIFDLSQLEKGSQSPMPQISPQTKSLLSLAKYDCKIIVFAPVSTSGDFYDYLASGQGIGTKVSLYLVGDLYGPGMPQEAKNRLANLITQAVKFDKVILENEGLEHVYPTYITDCVFGINKLTFSPSTKKIHYIVSEGAKTTLTCAYEIQNALRLTTGKEVGLFFSGPKVQAINEPEISPKIDFSPKVNLAEGLKKTFETLEKDHHATLIHIPRHFQAPVFQNNSQGAKSNRLPKIPAFFPNIKVKPLFLLITAALVLTLAKTALDLYLGQKNLKVVKNSLAAGDFENAKNSAKRAQNSFNAAGRKVKIITYPLSFILVDQISSLNFALEAAQLTSSSASYLIEGAQTLAHDFSIIAKPDAKNEGFDLETPSANFKKAHQKSSQAIHLLRSVKGLPFKSKIESIQGEISNLQSVSLRAYELVGLTDEFTGTGKKTTYLALLMNNTELRPGGGFIGNFAEISFDVGRLQNITVEDVYTIDGQLKEKIQPPSQLQEKLGVENYYLRDSNWSGDFEVNQKTARDFFKKETGKDVDGVIALDLTLVQKILEKIGPIKLADYDEEITSANLFERGEYYSEVGFFPGSTQKRDFFGALSRMLIAKILENPKSAGIIPLLEAAGEGLQKKHLMMTFDDPTLASFVKTKGWNQPLPPLNFNPADDTGQTRDFLALVEANLGANKVNRFLERKVSYEMTIGKDADLVANLEIFYTNNSQAETWPAGKHVNFLRVYVPQGSGLEDFQLSIPPEAKPSPKPRRSNQPISPQEDNVVDKNDVEVTTQGNLTVFSTFVEVPIKSTQVVTFKYRIPKNIKLETAPVYAAYFQKQAGTEKDLLEFKFNLPAYLEVKNISGDTKYDGQQNVVISTDLATDRQFTIELAKK